MIDISWFSSSNHGFGECFCEEIRLISELVDGFVWKIGLMVEKKIVLSQNHLEFGTNLRFSSVFTGFYRQNHILVHDNNLTVIKVSTISCFESLMVFQV